MLSQVEIKDFGPFTNKTVNFRPGVNLVVGRNGVGKTQLLGGILYGYYGPKAIEKNTVYPGTCEVTLDFIHEGLSKKLIRGFDKKLKHRLEVTFNLHPDVGINSPRNIQNYGFGSYPVFTNGEVKNRINYDINRLMRMIDQLDIGKLTHDFIMDLLAKINYESDNDKLLLRSAGEVYMVNMLNIATDIFEQKFDLLIIDELGCYLDHRYLLALVEILQGLTQNTQIIASISQHRASLLDSVDNINRIVLDRNFEENAGVRNLGFKYSFVPPSQKDQISHKKEIIRFKLGDNIIEEESIDTEFKEIKGDNPIRSVIDCVDQYVVAYLNSDHTNVGRIFWGISDDRSVKGVHLNYKQRDQLQRDVINKLLQIKPKSLTRYYSMKLHKVYDKNHKEIQDLFVFEVEVKPINEVMLFSTSKDEVFIKTNAGKKKLTTHEIQLELTHRIGGANNVGI